MIIDKRASLEWDLSQARKRGDKVAETLILAAIARLPRARK